MSFHVPTVKDVYRSAGFYPITGLYLGGVGIAALFFQGIIDLADSMISFAFLAVVALLLAAWKEIQKVRVQVDHQREELLVRINELQSMLVESKLTEPVDAFAHQKVTS